ncbi:MAG: RNA polymerase sigma factor RpoD/SigA, partial [Bacilli bacterium]|nr:RNA polymerase sigma factor RpoD/SigA [Bacilli bacterium]
MNNKALTKMNNLIAETKGKTIKKSAIKDTLWKNKDLQTEIQVNNCVQYLKDNGYRVINDIKNDDFKKTPTDKKVVKKETNKKEVKKETKPVVKKETKKETPVKTKKKEETKKKVVTKKETTPTKDTNKKEEITASSLFEDTRELDDDEEEVVDTIDVEEDEIDENEINEDFSTINNDYVETDDVKLYLRSIADMNLPILTTEEEQALGERIKQGDALAKEELVKHNLKLVVSIAKRYVGLGVDFMDLIQEGNIGLMIAAEKYKPELGFRFSTYATHWIRQHITRHIANTGRLIRLPVHMIEHARKIALAKRDLYEMTTKEPTIEEITEFINKNKQKYLKKSEQNKDITPEDVLNALTHIENSIVSLDAPLNKEEEDSTLIDFVTNPSEQSVEDVALDNELGVTLREVLSRVLTERELNVIIRRFGLEDNTPRTLEQVGKEFKVTRERIRQIEAKALRKL